MLASLIDVNHLIEVSGYPLLALLVMAESGGVPVPGETALIIGGVLASQGKLQIELVIAVAAAAAIVGDNIGYYIGRRGGRWLLRAPRPVSRPAPERARARRAVLRPPRAEGGLLRALHPGPAHVGLVAGGRQPHALAHVLPVERPRRDLLGDGRRVTRLLPRSLRRQPDHDLRDLRPRRGRDRRRRRRPPLASPQRAATPRRRSAPRTPGDAGAHRPVQAAAPEPGAPLSSRRERCAPTARRARSSSSSEKRERNCSRTTARWVPRAAQQPLATEHRSGRRRRRARRVRTSSARAGPPFRAGRRAA